ncbi:MAG: 2-isopropylmalate synthase [Clostridia bacterium]
MLKFFDTTLRDGEQSPNCSMNNEEKLEIATQLERLKVDVIEAGFAVCSHNDFQSIEDIAKKIKNCTICSLARALPKDIDLAYDSIKNAVSPRIHTFLATSPIHMQHKLKMTEDEVVERTFNMVQYAKKLVSDVQFSCEDATRSNLKFLSKVVQTAIKAGATVINIPDTVGIATPQEIETIITYLKQNTDVASVELSLHCHNDLGLAVANSLAGIRCGVNQIECTINGIGERAGNAALEEIAMALKTKNDFYNISFNLDTQQIYRTSKTVYSILGIKAPLNKAIVGANAFAHESGIHQHGLMEDKATYEIIAPEDIGINKDTIVLGKHSGKHAFAKRLEELGYSPTDAELEHLFEIFKDICDKKKDITDQDIEAIVNNKKFTIKKGSYKLLKYNVNSSNFTTASCVITLQNGDNTLEEVSIGDGPIAAAYNAIDKIVNCQGHSLENYAINSISNGKDALCEVIIKLKFNGRTFTGRGLSTDIIESSILAYLNGMNKILEEKDL